MHFDLRAHTHLLVVCGSRAYGTHTPTSDVDIKGVAVPPKEAFFGILNRFEQADKPENAQVFIEDLTLDEQRIAHSTKMEGTVYNIMKYMVFAMDANPNQWDLLFCREEDVRIMTPIGRKLRENRHLFLSGRARFSFAGFAHAQLKRIRGPQDAKHATHFLRLMRMCKEILTTGEVHVWRGGIDAEELRSIRNGNWSPERFLSMASELEAELEEIYRSKKYVVPKEPDRNKINTLCVDLIEEALYK